ncbi:MAG: hypothetical protein Q4F57_09665 [Weeksellaceae bacterium]|nr:hypothetical protein [Weeksellaceae bacterium]
MKQHTESDYWLRIQNFFAKHFGDGEKPDIDAMLFLIGVQELGQGKRKFSKDEKVNLLHIAVCRVLEPYDYYTFDGRDAQGWPHFVLKKPLPELKPNEQALMMKKAIIRYFKEHDLIAGSQED